MSDESAAWWHSLIAEARQLTVADLEYADDPKELLDKLPSVRVHHWLPRPGSEGYWYAVLHLQVPARWVGVGSVASCG